MFWKLPKLVRFLAYEHTWVCFTMRVECSWPFLAFCHSIATPMSIWSSCFIMNDQCAQYGLGGNCIGSSRKMHLRWHISGSAVFLSNLIHHDHSLAQLVWSPIKSESQNTLRTRANTNCVYPLSHSLTSLSFLYTVVTMIFAHVIVLNVIYIQVPQ